MSRSSWGSCWSRLWCMALLFCALATLLPAETPSEPPDWNSELESLKRLLLSQIAYAERLLELSEKQKARLIDYEALLEEQRQISQELEQRINDLEERLASSRESAQSLSLKLKKLGILHDRLEKQLELVSKSSAAFKQEAEKQIEQLQGERDRYKRGILLYITLAILTGILLGTVF